MLAEPEALLRSLPNRPGVYRMLDAERKVIYVGKARDLKKRVSSYFREQARRVPKTARLVERINAVEVTVTHTENEALILESNLIKRHRPKYNIWFRDDKSYPYIRVSMSHAFPRFSYHRGKRDKRDRYLGPFPSAHAAMQTLNLLQKLFRLRSCEDSVFAHRSRPCLQYQIDRCEAPCVGAVSKEEYRRSVDHALLFLRGDNDQVVRALDKPMQQAAKALDYERAAHYRDQIRNLRKVQEKQYITHASGNVDILACVIQSGQACVERVCVRNGLNLGSRAYFPGGQGAADKEAQVLSAWISQTWLHEDGERQSIPKEIIVSDTPEQCRTLEQELSVRAGKQVQIKCPRSRSHRMQWLEMARENAELSLRRHLERKYSQQTRMLDLQERLGGGVPLERIECFDISHTQGEATFASRVVFAPQGALKREYRHFEIRAETGGDDYLAMREAILRCYRRAREEQSELPGLILVDGGKGQVGGVARAALEELGLDTLPLLGVAKGEGRKAGKEKLILADGRRQLVLDPHSPAFDLILQIRDEAHRFAIRAHRSRRGKRRTQSELENIGGVGAQRRQALLRHFGGLRGVMRAGVEDLSQVKNISRTLAKKIHAHFHRIETS